MSVNPRRSAHSKKLLANPEHLARLRAGSARVWEDPERRARRVAAISAGVKAAAEKRNLRKKRARKIAVPGWVPEGFRAAFVEWAREKDEFYAAAKVRAAKREGATP
jgi:hypothetical protein